LALWNEIFCEISNVLEISIFGNSGEGNIRITDNKQTPSLKQSKIDKLKFPSEYINRSNIVGPQVLASHILRNDIKVLIDLSLQSGYKGILILLDEADKLINSNGIKQQLRNVIQEFENCGLVFVGLKTIGEFFTDPSEPFYNQAFVILLSNYVNIDDIAECASSY